MIFIGFLRFSPAGPTAFRPFGTGVKSGSSFSRFDQNWRVAFRASEIGLFII